MRKRTVLIGLVLIAAAGGGLYYYKNYYNQEKSASAESAEGSVYMSKVSDIMDQGALGIKTRLVGVVDPQESKDIKLDSDKQLKETFVEVGDEVKKGDPLFSYDVEAMKQKIQEADLELEEMNNTLQTMNQQLNELNVQASKAKESEKQAYNLQILSAQNSIHKQEYNISVKQLERAQLEKNVDNAVVYSDIDGIVKSINSDSSGSGDSYNYGSSGSNAFMTILATGDYRIKGTCNEMNIYSLYVGEQMVIRPRADEDKIYTGVVSKIETEPATDNNNNGYSDSSAESSKYHFYVTVNEAMDLMLGQHVIMEEDTGETEEKTGLWIPNYYVVSDDETNTYYVWSCDDNQKVCKKEISVGEIDEDLMLGQHVIMEEDTGETEEKTGLWIPNYYVVSDDETNTYYVWSCDDNQKVCKKEISVGEIDEEMLEYQILEGLTEDDYIAFPDELTQEGMEAILPDSMENGENQGDAGNAGAMNVME